MRILTLGALAAAMVSAGLAQETTVALSGSSLIDHHLRAKWDEAGLKPAARAGDAEFLRRAYLDIAGVIPSLDEAERFLKDGGSSKRERLVETLLKDARYAEHQATIWSGILVGFDNDRRDQAARADEKDDLVEVFRKNVAYDEFARKAITVDGAVYEYQQLARLPEAERKNLPAEVGLAAYVARQERVAGRQDFPLAMAGKVTRVFMGVQIQCAQCHDHPFDKWTQEEFYGMASFFTGLQAQRAQYIPEAARGDREKAQRMRIQYYDVKDSDDRKADAQTPRERLRERMMGAGRDLTIPNSKSGPIKPSFLETGKGAEAGVSRRTTFAKYITEKENLQFAKMAVNRYWGQFFGAGIVNPVDDFNGRNRPTHPELLESLAKDFIAHKYDLHWLVKAITGSEAYNLSSRSAGKERDPAAEKFFALSRVRALMPEQILRSVVEATDAGQGMARAGLAGRLRDMRKDDKKDDPKGAPSMGDAMRERLIESLTAQFRFNFGDDEGGEVADFSGTIPSALLMMNHPMLMGMGTSSMGGGLRQVLSKHETPEARLKAIFLAALTRNPSDKELSRWKGHVGKAGNVGYEDCFWTLLNTSEFLFNH
jgi:hypothetical protein